MFKVVSFILGFETASLFAVIGVCIYQWKRGLYD